MQPIKEFIYSHVDLTESDKNENLALASVMSVCLFLIGGLLAFGKGVDPSFIPCGYASFASGALCSIICGLLKYYGKQPIDDHEETVSDESFLEKIEKKELNKPVVYKPVLPPPRTPVLTESSALSKFDQVLNEDTKVTILSFLKFRELLVVRMTSKAWRKLAQSEQLASDELGVNSLGQSIFPIQSAAGYYGRLARDRIWGPTRYDTKKTIFPNTFIDPLEQIKTQYYVGSSEFFGYIARLMRDGPIGFLAIPSLTIKTSDELQQIQPNQMAHSLMRGYCDNGNTSFIILKVKDSKQDESVMKLIITSTIQSTIRNFSDEDINKVIRIINNEHDDIVLV